ncbi:immunoglobulin-like domain-containing protein, partial [Erysipelothrix urinaevulpis]
MKKEKFRFTKFLKIFLSLVIIISTSQITTQALEGNSETQEVENQGELGEIEENVGEPSEEEGPIDEITDDSVKEDLEQPQIDDSQELVEEPVDQLEEKQEEFIVRAGSVEVSTWENFKKAYDDPSVSEINLSGDITSNSNLNITRSTSLKINGNGHTIDSRTHTGYLFRIRSTSTPQVFELNNVVFNHANNYVIYQTTTDSNNWTYNFNNISNTGSQYPNSIITAQEATVNITGDLTWANNAGNNTIVAKDINVNNAKLIITGTGNNRAFYTQRISFVNTTATVSTQYNVIDANINNTEESFVKVKNSKLDFTTKYTGAGPEQSTILLGRNNNQNKVRLEITEGSVLNVQVNGNGYGDGRHAGIAIAGDNRNSVGSGVLVNGGSKVNIKSMKNGDATPGFVSQISEGADIVIEGSGTVFDIWQNVTDNQYRAAMRFFIVGGQKLYIKDKAELNIHSEGGRSPSVRMYGQANEFNVSGGSKVNIKNKGDGTDRNPGTNDNVAIVFTGGNNTNSSKFVTTGVGTEMNIISDHGAAVYSNDALDIEAGKDTIYVARGTTSSATQGIFGVSRLQFTTDSPLYYDFANTRSGGGLVFSGMHSSSTYKSQESDLAVWLSGDNVFGDPHRSWPLFSFELSDAKLGTIVDTDQKTEFNSQTFGSMADYSRINGNNSYPTIDWLRTPEDTDRYIFGHAIVPEGMNTNSTGSQGGRDAWTDEVWVSMRETKKDGTIREFNAQLKNELPTRGKSNTEPGVEVYEQGYLGGVFYIDLGEGNLAEIGDKYEVLSAYRGTPDLAENRKRYVTAPFPNEVTVIDKTPPNPASISNNLYAYMNVVEGTSDEPGSRVTVKINGEFVTGGTSIDPALWPEDGRVNTVVGTDGKWRIELPAGKSFNAEDVVQIILTDKLGNSNPVTTKDYHDTTFIKGTETIVEDLNFTLEAFGKTVGRKEAATIDTEVKLLNALKASATVTGETTEPTDVTIKSWGGFDPNDIKAGEFPIEVAIKDAPTISKTVILKVLPWDIVIETENYYLVANDFYTGVKQVDEVDTKIIKRANAEAILKSNESQRGTVLIHENKMEPKEGVYGVTFKVAEELDSPDNRLTVNATVLDRDIVEEYDDYVIAANHIRIGTSKAKNIQNEDLINWTEAVAWNKNDLTTPLDVEVKSHTVIDTEGTYNATFNLIGSKDVVVTVNIEVNNLTPPVIIAPEVSLVDLDANFDPLVGVIATDVEDGDLTDKITVSGDTVDTSKPGAEYVVQYSVTDSDGNTTTAFRLIIINDGTYTIHDDKLLRAYDFVVSATTMEGSDDEILKESSAKAWLITNKIENGVVVGINKTSIDPTNLIVREKGNYSEKTKGEHKITISINGMPKLNKEITGKVIDQEIIVTGDRYIIAANNFNLNQQEATAPRDMELYFKRAKLTVFERIGLKEIDNAAEVTIDKVEPIHNEQGYDVQFSVKDEKTTSADVLATVNNLNPPSISLNPIVILNVNDSFDHLENVTASDIEDGDLTDKIEVDGLDTLDLSKEGIYELTYNVTDSDNNTTSRKRQVFVNPYGIQIGDYVVSARNFAVWSNEMTGTEAEILKESSSQAWHIDPSTGEITKANEKLKVKKTNGYENKSPGNYGIEIGIIDIDTPVKEVVGIISDKPVSIGDKYFIYAKGFNLNVADATPPHDLDMFKDGDHGDVRVQEIDTLTFVNKSTEVKKNTIKPIETKNGINPYDLSFVVTDDLEAEVFVKVTVDNLNVPVLNVTSPIRIPLNGEFDAMSGVSASDIEDGDLSDKVEVTENNVDVATRGHYTVKYAVEDSDGNNTSKTRHVFVGNYIIDGDYVFDARHFAVSIDDVLGTNDEIIKLSNAEAYKVNGNTLTNINDQIEVVSSGDYSTKTAGVYKIKIQIKDRVKTSKEINGEIVNGPVKVGEDYILYASDFNLNQEQATPPHSETLFKDENHGNVYVKERENFTIVDLKTTIETNTVKPDFTSSGNYYDVSFVAHLGNEKLQDTELQVKVTVNNMSEPVITLTSPIVLQLNEVFDAKKGVTAYDEEDGSLTNEIVISDNTVDTSIEGHYTVKYSVTDKDNNTVSKIRHVFVGDYTILDEEYVIKANNFGISKKSMLGTHGEIISKSKAEAYHIVNDEMVNVDSEIVVKDDNNYSSKEEGIYSIIIGIKDVVETKTIRALVSENAGENERYIITSKDFNLNETQATKPHDEKLFMSKDFADVTVYDKQTLKIVDKEVGVGENTIEPILTTGENKYRITFFVIEDSADKAETTSLVTVDNLNKPVIDFTTPFYVPLNTVFNEMEEVSASDVEDGDLTDKIEVIRNTVDTSKRGVYEVDYQVKDSDNNTSKRTRIVTTIPTVGSYIIDAYNFAVQIDEMQATNQEIIKLSNASAWIVKNDKLTSIDDKIIVTNSGNYLNKEEGIHEISLSIDTEESAPVVDVKAKVSKLYPQIGEEYILYANNFNLNLVDAEKHDHDMYQDELHGNVYVELRETFERIDVPTRVKTDKVKAIPTNPGEYYDTSFIVVKNGVDVKDTENLREVTVSNLNKPLLSVTSPIHIPLNGVFDSKEGVVATDFEDGLITDKVIEVSNDVDVTKEGHYTVVYSVTDSDYNTVTRTRHVYVGDYTVGDKYVVKGNNFAVNVKDASGSDAEILSLSESKAWYINEEDQQVSADNMLEVVSKENYGNLEIGPHNIVIRVKGTTDTNTSIVGKITPFKPFIGEEFIIYAKDFNLNMEQAKAHNLEEFMKLSEVFVESRKTLQIVDEEVQIGKDTVKAEYTPKGEYYDVSFFVVNEPNTEIQVRVTVDDLNKPVLSVPDFTVLQVNDAFDPMTGVKALDEEDGDITQNVSIV